MSGPPFDSVQQALAYAYAQRHAGASNWPGSARMRAGEALNLLDHCAQAALIRAMVQRLPREGQLWVSLHFGGRGLAAAEVRVLAGMLAAWLAARMGASAPAPGVLSECLLWPLGRRLVTVRTLAHAAGISTSSAYRALVATREAVHARCEAPTLAELEAMMRARPGLLVD